MKKGYKNLYCIIGASGSGKTAVADLLKSKYSKKILISFTTRPKRHEGDKDHVYITEEEYKALEDKVATTEINGYHYCATAQQIDESDFYVVDWHGFDELLTKYHGRKKGIYVIYIDCSEEVRRERMLWRGDKPDRVEDRIKSDRVMFSDEIFANHCKHIIKTINSENVTEGVVAGVVRIIADKKDRKTK